MDIEYSVSHGVEDDNDFTECVASRGIVRSSSFEFVTTYNQPVKVSEPLYHFPHYPAQTQSSHVQQRGHDHSNVPMVGGP